ncbi:MAG: cbb3-type cytochrome oxidase assembly protein CcoS [Halioglobus sp.]
MPSLYILIPIALIFCVVAIKLLLWAINNGQYDDLDKEAWRILAESDEATSEKKPPPEKSEGSAKDE